MGSETRSHIVNEHISIAYQYWFHRTHFTFIMGRTKKQHNTKPAMDVPAPAAPATPILTAPAVSDALPVAPEKGYLRATIESETV